MHMIVLNLNIIIKIQTFLSHTSLIDDINNMKSFWSSLFFTYIMSSLFILLLNVQEFFDILYAQEVAKFM